MFNIETPEGKFDLYIDIGLSINAPKSVEWLSSKPDAFVIGIEPNPRSIESIRSKENLFPHLPFDNNTIPASEKRFYLIQGGVANVDTPEIRSFNMMQPDPGTSSFLKSSGVLESRGYSVESVIDVKVFSLESLLNSINWDSFNTRDIVIKSDTQGYELEVLQSLGPYISNVKSLEIEITTHGQYQNAEESQDIIKYATDHNLQYEKTDSGGNAWFKKKL